MTQEKFKAGVEPLITIAIRSIYKKPYSFEFMFEEKRNYLTCRPVVKEGSVKRDPIADLGGGVIDIISFASRVVFWSLPENTQNSPIIYLDEPLKNMGKLVIFGAEVLKKVCDKLKFQLIINTHEEAILEVADTAYEIDNDGKKSMVRRLK
jgi:DNA repair exonuclease SbcCD ATPase subunit